MTYIAEKLFELSSLSRIWKRMLDDVHFDVLSTGRPIDYIKQMNFFRNGFIYSLIICTPVSLITHYFGYSILLSLNIIPVLLFFFPKIQLLNLSQQRKKLVDEELALSSMFLSIMQSVGVNMYNSFQIMKNTGLFNAMNKESNLLKRNVEVFGLSEMESIEELGKSHKNQQFQNLLLGYTSIWRSGGDLALYLESRAEEFFLMFKSRFTTYSNNVGTVIEALVTLMIILPILIMVVSFVMPGGSMEQITSFAVVGLPMFAIILGVMITNMQPKIPNRVGLNQTHLSVMFGIGFASAIISYIFLNFDIWLSISLGFLVPSLITGVIVMRQMHQIKQFEHALPQFLRDITEYKKIGYDVTQAMIHISKENSYNKAFDEQLLELRILLENGITPSMAVKSLEQRSWFSGISFFIISYIAEFGGGSPRILETITQFVINIRQTLSESKSAISFYGMLIFASPIIMVMTAIVIHGMLDSIDTSSLQTTNIVQDQTNPFSSSFLNLVTVTPEFLSLIKTMIITSSFMSAFVVTKATDFTFFNTWRVVVVGTIAIISVILFEMITTGKLNIDELTVGGIF